MLVHGGENYHRCFHRECVRQKSVPNGFYGPHLAVVHQLSRCRGDRGCWQRLVWRVLFCLAVVKKGERLSHDLTLNPPSSRLQLLCLLSHRAVELRHFFFSFRAIPASRVLVLHGLGIRRCLIRVTRTRKSTLPKDTNVEISKMTYRSAMDQS